MLTFRRYVNKNDYLNFAKFSEIWGKTAALTQLFLPILGVSTYHQSSVA
jgi:hypothetical protein